MIAFLEGTLESKQTGVALINVQGVGFRVEISTQTFEHLPPAGQPVRLLTYHHFTDSDQRLFGFLSVREQKLFERLITVKGVGPKLGLTILSGMSAAALVEAIVDQDHPSLSRIPGIGKKSAERIILELKDKLLDGTEGTGRAATGEKTGAGPEEAISALEALGFKKRDAEKAVLAITRKEKDADVSEIVKRALKQHSG